MNQTDLILLRKQLISESVDWLKRLGFEKVTETTIFEDDVYKVHFLRILMGKLGENVHHDCLIKEMILEIAQ